MILQIKKIQNESLRYSILKYYIRIRNYFSSIPIENRRVSSSNNPSGIYCELKDYVEYETYYTWDEYKRYYDKEHL